MLDERTGQRSALIVLDVDEHRAMGSYKNMLIVIWRKETRASAAQSAKHALARLIAHHPKGVGIMQVIEERANPPPDADARRELSAMLASGIGTVQCSSVLHEGQGFRAAMVRGVVTAITLFTKPPYPHVVMERVSEAALWHAQILHEEYPAQYAEGLMAAVEELRSKFDQRAFAAHG